MIVVRGGPVHCGVASSILDFYLLDASNIPLQLLITSCDNQKCLQALWNVPWWKLHGRKSDALITDNDDKYWYFLLYIGAKQYTLLVISER